MIKIYGMETCPHCASVHSQITGKENEYEFIDIGSHVRKLKEFLKLRDNNPIFEQIKASGRVGIPCFVFEDDSISLNPDDVGLKSEIETTSCCSMADHLEGKKDC